MNMPDVRKKSFNSLMPLDTIARLKKLARETGQSVGEIQASILERELKERVCLDADDFAWIEAEIKKNMERRSGRIVES